MKGGAMSGFTDRPLHDQLLNEIAREWNDALRIHVAVTETEKRSVEKFDISSLSKTQQTVITVWKEIAGVMPDPKVGFLEQGGDSLLAMQVISRLVVIYGVDIPMETLLDDLSPLQLAEVIDRNVSKASDI